MSAARVSDSVDDADAVACIVCLSFLFPRNITPHPISVLPERPASDPDRTVRCQERQTSRSVPDCSTHSASTVRLSCTDATDS